MSTEKKGLEIDQQYHLARQEELKELAKQIQNLLEEEQSLEKMIEANRILRESKKKIEQLYETPEVPPKKIIRIQTYILSLIFAITAFTITKYEKEYSEIITTISQKVLNLFEEEENQTEPLNSEDSTNTKPPLVEEKTITVKTNKRKKEEIKTINYPKKGKTIPNIPVILNLNGTINIYKSLKSWKNTQWIYHCTYKQNGIQNHVIEGAGHHFSLDESTIKGKTATVFIIDFKEVKPLITNEHCTKLKPIHKEKSHQKANLKNKTKNTHKEKKSTPIPKTPPSHKPKEKSTPDIPTLKTLPKPKLKEKQQITPPIHHAPRISIHSMQKRYENILETGNMHSKRHYKQVSQHFKDKKLANLAKRLDMYPQDKKTQAAFAKKLKQLSNNADYTRGITNFQNGKTSRKLLSIIFTAKQEGIL